MGNKNSGLEFFRQVFGGSWITQGLWAAAELGLADLLSDGPCTAGQLAQRSHAHPESLYRLLRALASAGVFCQDPQGRFSLTPVSELLRSDLPGSQRAFAMMMGAEFCRAWGELLYSVTTGRPGFDKHFGVPFFQYMTDHPDRHRLYDSAMTGIHGPETDAMLDAYDFSAFKSVADIGGGNGSALSVILKRHPAIQGILFDLPPVVERARADLLTSSLNGRIRLVGGDFFAAVPADADAYVLRHILHDWQDDDAVKILSNCRDAMSPGGRILVVEMVIPDGDTPGFGKWLDLMMLVVAGRERTRDEYGRLFSEAGLKMLRVIPTASEVSILEAQAL